MEIAESEDEPGEAKNAEAVVLGVVVEVKRPVPVSVAVSDGVKTVPGMVVEVGLVVIRWMYLSTSTVS